MTRYVMIIIQFLYNKFSLKIKKRLLPIYLLHMASLLLMLYMHEIYREEIRKAKEESGGPDELS